MREENVIGSYEMVIEEKEREERYRGAVRQPMHHRKAQHRHSMQTVPRALYTGPVGICQGNEYRAKLSVLNLRLPSHAVTRLKRKHRQKSRHLTLSRIVNGLRPERLVRAVSSIQHCVSCVVSRAVPESVWNWVTSASQPTLLGRRA
jgi:hypothetical protein